MLRIFKNIGKRDIPLIFIAVVFVACMVWLDLKLPDYMSEITTLISTGNSDLSPVIQAGAKMLGCAFASLLLSVAVSFCAARVASDFSANVRERLFDSVQNFSLAEINHFSTASLVTRSTNDVTQVQMLIVMGLMVIVRAPIMATWAIIKISGKSWQWTGATGAAVAVLALLVLIVVGSALPKFRMMQSLTDNVNRVVRENLTGLKVVRAYNAEDYQEKKFHTVNSELTGTSLFIGKRMAFLLPTIMLVLNGLTLSIYWIGTILIDRAGLVEKVAIFSDMIVFISYAMQVVMAFMMLVMIFFLFPRASVSAKRILEVIETTPSVTDGNETTSLDSETGSIEFRNVSFRYPDAEADVISDISFRAQKGQTVALIGATGSGKTSVINLIPRFYDATEGQILVDGRDVKDYTLNALRNRIGYVSQSAVLFSGSIASNIAYGDNGNGPADQEQIQRAAKIAEAEEFISAQNGTYEGHVAQNGTNFSGGQRQRMSIARAIARNPEILIFDDSFSALDYRTDRVLRSNLAKECKDTTKIIVAQRIGTIRDADLILVLEDGRIAGSGTHDQLMENCEVYRQIAYSQLSKEELEGGSTHASKTNE